VNLDRSVIVRWYVEGETEYWALREYIDEILDARIELINLRGQIAAKRALSFRDDLISNDKEQVFSMISFDGDVSENLRVAKRAAIDDIFCGSFYVARPDFEMFNFTIEEHINVVKQIALEKNVSEDTINRLEIALKGARTGKEIEEIARKTDIKLNRFGKGEEWGRRLAQYSMDNSEHPMSGERRPFLQALDLARMGWRPNYKISRQYYRINPETGLPVRKESNNS
jgi:hypothetical protein